MPPRCRLWKVCKNYDPVSYVCAGNRVRDLMYCGTFLELTGEKRVGSMYVRKRKGWWKKPEEVTV